MTALASSSRLEFPSQKADELSIRGGAVNGLEVCPVESNACLFPDEILPETSIKASLNKNTGHGSGGGRCDLSIGGGVYARRAHDLAYKCLIGFLRRFSIDITELSNGAHNNKKSSVFGSPDFPINQYCPLWLCKSFRLSL